MGTTVLAGNIENVAGGSNANDTSVFGGQFIEQGGSATVTTVYNGGWQWVGVGGEASSTIVKVGGMQVVDGTASGTDLYGEQYVESGGEAEQTDILGGLQFDAGVAYNTYIYANGEQIVRDGGARQSDQRL